MAYICFVMDDFTENPTRGNSVLKKWHTYVALWRTSLEILPVSQSETYGRSVGAVIKWFQSETNQWMFPGMTPAKTRENFRSRI